MYILPEELNFLVFMNKFFSSIKLASANIRNNMAFSIDCPVDNNYIVYKRNTYRAKEHTMNQHMRKEFTNSSSTLFN